MTVTITSCEPQAGREYCEIKVEQNGKLVYKDVDLREQVLAGVKSCLTQASSSPAAGKPATIANGKSFNPSYLNEMPSVDRVMEAMKTTDPRETALRRSTASAPTLPVRCLIEKLELRERVVCWLPGVDILH
jgi:hypothetical protein